MMFLISQNPIFIFHSLGNPNFIFQFEKSNI